MFLPAFWEQCAYVFIAVPVTKFVVQKQEDLGIFILTTRWTTVRGKYISHLKKIQDSVNFTAPTEDVFWINIRFNFSTILLNDLTAYPLPCKTMNHTSLRYSPRHQTIAVYYIYWFYLTENSITDISHFLSFRKIIAVCENHTRHKYTVQANYRVIECENRW